MSCYYVWHEGHSGVGRDVIVRPQSGSCSHGASSTTDKTHINKIILCTYDDKLCKDSEGKVQGAT